MKLLSIALLLVLTPVLSAKAQDSRIQMSSLDHLAAKASQTVDVNLDERLMRLAARVFDDKDTDEREVKKLVAGLKGIYVKSFEFDTEGQYTPGDLETIRTQLRGPGWTRADVVARARGCSASARDWSSKAVRSIGRDWAAARKAVRMITIVNSPRGNVPRYMRVIPCL